MFFLLGMLALAASGCTRDASRKVDGPTGSNPAVAAPMKTFEDKVCGIALQYPSSWNMMTDSDQLTRMAGDLGTPFKSSFRANPDPGKNSFIGVRCTTDSKFNDMMGEDLVYRYIQDIKRAPGNSLQKVEKVSLDGLTAIRATVNHNDEIFYELMVKLPEHFTVVSVWNVEPVSLVSGVFDSVHLLQTAK